MDLTAVDGVWNDLSPQYDLLIDPATYFDLDNSVGEEFFWRSITKRAFAATMEAFEEAYKYGDDSSAIEYFEQFATPAMRRHHGIEEDRILDLNYWANRSRRELGDITRYPDFHQSVSNNQYQDLYEALRHRFDGDEFDHLVGVFGGGLPALSVAGAYLDGEELVLRYSHLRRDDDEVQVTATMDERADFTDASVLIVDDVVGTGETMERVGGFVAERGADEIYGMALSAEFYVFRPDGLHVASKEGLEAGERYAPSLVSP